MPAHLPSLFRVQLDFIAYQVTRDVNDTTTVTAAAADDEERAEGCVGNEFQGAAVCV